jgi:predicted TIM-barrel fold metal-dependent hydrolase
MQKIFDSHFHIIDPKFELIENNGFVPDYYTTDDYLNELEEIGLEAIGGAVVSGSFQGFDQSYFADALQRLGENFVGVTQLPFDTTDEELAKLHTIGIRGIRFNLYRGFDSTLSEIEELSLRVYKKHGWKTEFYINLAETEDDLKELILSLPAASIDHIGMTKVPAETLTAYTNKGVPIRLTGFGRVEYGREEVARLIRYLYDANPDGLIFGTDLPSTRAEYRFSKADVELIQEVLTADECEKVFWKNGYNWYLD